MSGLMPTPPMRTADGRAAGGIACDIRRCGSEVGPLIPMGDQLARKRALWLRRAGGVTPLPAAELVAWCQIAGLPNL